MEEPYDDHFEKFLSAYPGYVRKIRKPLVPAAVMERVNAALDRMRPSKEEWEKEFENIRRANMEAKSRRYGHSTATC